VLTPRFTLWALTFHAQPSRSNGHTRCREIRNPSRSYPRDICGHHPNKQHTSAVQRAALALRSQAAVGIEMVGKGLAGIVAGRKAQPAWKRYGNGAGIACLRKEPGRPSPAAIAAAGLHSKRLLNTHCSPAPAAIVVALERAAAEATEAAPATEAVNHLPGRPCRRSLRSPHRLPSPRGPRG